MTQHRISHQLLLLVHRTGNGSPYAAHSYIHVMGISRMYPSKLRIIIIIVRCSPTTASAAYTIGAIELNRIAYKVHESLSKYGEKYLLHIYYTNVQHSSPSTYIIWYWLNRICRMPFIYSTKTWRRGHIAQHIYTRSTHFAYVNFEDNQFYSVMVSRCFPFKSTIHVTCACIELPVDRWNKVRFSVLICGLLSIASDWLWND